MNIKRVIASFLGDELFAYSIDGTIYYVWHSEHDPEILEELKTKKINREHFKYINPLTLDGWLFWMFK
jgi:hypothetical protein